MEMCKFDTQIYSLHLKFMHMPFVRLPGKMESITALSLCGKSYLLELSTEVHSQQEFQLRLLLQQLLLVHNSTICIFDARKHLLTVSSAWNMLFTGIELIYFQFIMKLQVLLTNRIKTSKNNCRRIMNSLFLWTFSLKTLPKKAYLILRDFLKYALKKSSQRYIYIGCSWNY